MSSRTLPARVVQTATLTFALILGSLLPLAVAPAVAQGELPATAAAAPAASIYFQEFDLDLEGGQWQQTDELLARIGIPDALETWRQELLAASAQSGDFTEADLDALLGGEIAIAVTPDAITHLSAMHAMHEQMQQGEDTEMEMPPDMAVGAAVILDPGDPVVAWEYVQRQFSQSAAEMNEQVIESTYGDAALLELTFPNNHLRGRSSGDDAQNDGMDHQMPADFGLYAGQAGEFIVVGMTRADVTNIIDVVNGEQPSLADLTEAEDVATALPADSLAFGYFNGSAIVDGLDEEALAELQTSMPDLDPSELHGHGGFTLGAGEAGFQFVSIAMGMGASAPSEMAADPAIATAASHVPADSFVFQTGMLPRDAFVGTAYQIAVAINAATAGTDVLSGEILEQLPNPGEIRDQLPNPADMQRQLALAERVLGFNLQSGLIDLLGDHFLLYSSVPRVSPAGMGLDAAVAIETTDPATLSANIAKIVKWAGRVKRGMISERSIDSNAIYAVSDPSNTGVPPIEFGVIGNYLVAGTGSGVDHLVMPGAPLADDPQYQAVLAELPETYQQLTYVNVGQGSDLLTGLFAQLGGTEPAASAETPEATTGGLDAIRAFASAVYQDENGTGTSAILFIPE